MRKWLIATAVFFNTLAWATEPVSSEAAPEAVKEVSSTPEKVQPAVPEEAAYTNPFTGEAGKLKRGALGLTIQHVSKLNALLKQDPSPEITKDVHATLQSVDALIPSLKISGMFNVFSLQEWIANTKAQPGRTLVAIQYLQRNPEEMNQPLKRELMQIQHDTSSPYLKKGIERLLVKK